MSESEAWKAIVADLSGDAELRDGGRRLEINDPSLPDPVIDELLAEGPLEHEEFVPPEPDPIPAPRDAIARFAWAGVVGGPIAIIVASVLDWQSMWTVGGLVAFTAGFVTLIGRHHPAERDDDGAVV